MNGSPEKRSSSAASGTAAFRWQQRLYTWRWRLANALAWLSLRVAPKGPAKDLLERLYREYTARVNHEIRYCEVMAFRSPASRKLRAHAGEQGRA